MMIQDNDWNKIGTIGYINLKKIDNYSTNNLFR